MKNNPDQESSVPVTETSIIRKNNSVSRGAVLYASVLILLHVAGYLFFSSVTWGINYFSFLPPAVIGIYFLLGVGLVAYGIKGIVNDWPNLFVRYWAEKPYFVVTITVFCFFAVAALLRVRLPMLGDCFVIINNYENTINGIHQLHPFREPLAVYFFYWIIKLLGTSQYPDMLTAFLVGEYILGALFIVAVSLIVKSLFVKPNQQILLFFFLVTIPSMQIFLGYAEIYAVVLLATSFFVLIGIRYLEHGKLFYLIYPAYLLLLFTHFLGIILFPVILYLTVIEYRTRRIKNIGLGLGFVATIAGGLFAMFGEEILRFLPQGEHEHFLSFFPSGDAYQAYPFFSFFHFTEILNLFLLISPISFYLIVASRNSLWKAATSSRIRMFLTICSVSFLLFVLTAKFDLGMAKDWDVTASFFFIFNLTAVIYYFYPEETEREPNFVLLVLVGLLGCIPWFYLNATEEPNVRRTISLMDSRIQSREGYYQTSFHLSMAYLRHDDTTSVINVWKAYIAKYPDDGKGYGKLAQAYRKVSPVDLRIPRVYERWLQVEPSNRDARTQYAQYCAEIGTTLFANHRNDDAKQFFLKSLSIDSTYPTAYNNLGYYYAETGSLAKAESLYRQAMNLNPAYKLPYNNLANIYRDDGKYEDAISLYLKAINLDSNYVLAYENLAKTYFLLKDREKTVAALQQAARLGSQSSQESLTKAGEKW